MKALLLLMLLSLSQASLAAELRLALITSDIDKNTTEFLMEVDAAKDIHSIRIKTTTPAGRVTEDFSYSSEEVLRGSVVLHEREGYKAVRLRVEQDFSTVSGGGVILDYLYSGVSGNRYFLSLRLVRLESGFALQKMNGDPVNRFFFRANRHPLFGIVGVREIILSHQ